MGLGHVAPVKPAPGNIIGGRTGAEAAGCSASQGLPGWGGVEATEPPLLALEWYGGSCFHGLGRNATPASLGSSSQTIPCAGGDGKASLLCPLKPSLSNTFPFPHPQRHSPPGLSLGMRVIWEKDQAGSSLGEPASQTPSSPPTEVIPHAPAGWASSDFPRVGAAGHYFKQCCPIVVGLVILQLEKARLTPRIDRR